MRTHKPLGYKLPTQVTPSYTLRQSRAWQGLQWALSHSRTLQLANKGKNVLSQLLNARMNRGANGIAGQEVGLDDSVYLEPSSEDWAEAWRVTEELITVMHNEVRAHHARFVLVTLSNGIQVHPDPQVRRAFMQRLNTRDVFYPDRRIKALADREKIEMVMLAPELQRYAESKQVYVHGFPNVGMGSGHWNEEGHRFAAQFIAKTFCGSSLGQ